MTIYKKITENNSVRKLVAYLKKHVEIEGVLYWQNDIL